MRGFSPRLIISKQIHPLYQAELAEVRGHARFVEAVNLHVDAQRVPFGLEGDPYFAKYIGDVGNVLIENAVLYFHLLKKHENSGAGATLGKVQLVAFAHGFASPRRVTMYVKRMVQTGRLSYSADVEDKRVRRIVPCEPLIATSVHQMSVLLRAVDVLWPGRGYADRCAGDGDFFGRLILRCGEKYLNGADPVRPFSDVRHFTSKDAGTFLLNALVYGCLGRDNRLSSENEFSVGYSEIAQSLGVSRTHVRNVIEAAEARGLISHLGEGGKSMRLTPKMIEAYEKYFACLLILARSAAEQAIEEGATR